MLLREHSLLKYSFRTLIPMILMLASSNISNYEKCMFVDEPCARACFSISLSGRALCASMFFYSTVFPERASSMVGFRIWPHHSLKHEFLALSRSVFFLLQKTTLAGIRRYLCDYLELKEKSNIYGYVLFEICSFPGSSRPSDKLFIGLGSILGTSRKKSVQNWEIFSCSTPISSF